MMKWNSMNEEKNKYIVTAFSIKISGLVVLAALVFVILPINHFVIKKNVIVRILQRVSQ